MSKIMLILTCAIQMINVISIEPGIRDQKYFCHCLCLSPLCENFWLVGCFGFNGPLRQYFSLYPAVSQREGERKEK